MAKCECGKSRRYGINNAQYRVTSKDAKTLHRVARDLQGAGGNGVITWWYPHEMGGYIVWAYNEVPTHNEGNALTDVQHFLRRYYPNIEIEYAVGFSAFIAFEPRECLEAMANGVPRS